MYTIVEVASENYFTGTKNKADRAWARKNPLYIEQAFVILQDNFQTLDQTS